MTFSLDYTYSGAFIPGTLARAEQVATEFLSVQAGFALLAYQGTDTGAANAYVVTTPGAPTGAYADGQLVQFKAVNANTGGSTINVNGLGVVALIRAGGAASQAGDITASTWFTAIYNSTFSAFTIITPVPVTGFTNTISGAAPTHLVGLVAAGGVANAAAPIDVTFAIDQTISPTWTGTHTFAGNVVFNATVTYSGGQALTGVAGAYALILNGNAATGQSYGLKIAAGTNASDLALLVNSQGGTQFLAISGVGSVTVGSPTGGGQGVGTINATGLFINGVAVNTASVSGANPTGTVGLTAVNGVATTYLRSDGAPPLSQAISPTMTAAWIFTPSSAVTAITINAAVNATAMSLVGGTNTVNTYLLTLATGRGSGLSSGVSLSAGTSSADVALLVQNAAASATFFEIFGDGHGAFGPSASLGFSWTAAGAFTLAAPNSGNALTVAGEFVMTNGNAGTTTFAVNPTEPSSLVIRAWGPTAGALVDLTPDTGIFTITYTGMSSTVTATAVWTRVGNLVILYIPQALGTSNATSFNATGLPTEIQAARGQYLAVPVGGLENNGGTVAGTFFVGASGTMQFGNGIIGGTWTSSGSKGVANAFTVAYLLN